METPRPPVHPAHDPHARHRHRRDLLTACLGYAQLVRRALAQPEIDRDRLLLLNGKLLKYLAALDASIAHEDHRRDMPEAEEDGRDGSGGG